jgi:ankyrin repeat protein
MMRQGFTRAWPLLVLLAAGGAASAAAPDAAQLADADDGTTPLHWAVYRSDVAEVKRLIASGADVNAQNDYGATPLSEAAVAGNVEVIERLLKAGAKVDAANADGQTALMIIARTSNVEAAQLLLKRGAKVDQREAWRQQTALMWAAAEGQPAMVRLLVKAGADANARSLENNFERQVTAEPRMQARPAGGMTPLLFAARRGCAECARILVEEGRADVNLTDPERVTPLLLAALNLNYDTAALLLKLGADVNKWDTWGRSPLYAAVDTNTQPTGGRADRPSADRTTGIELIELLLKAGANPNLQLKLFPPYRSLRDDRGADTLLTVGTTPLLRAAKAVDVPAIRLLLAAGALVDLPTVNGVTPLMAAAGVGSGGLDTRGRYRDEAAGAVAVQLLLEAGADARARDKSGNTALHAAAGAGWNSVVSLLVAHDADLFARDGRGRMAVDLTRGEAGAGGRSAGTPPQPETEALLRKLMVAADAGKAP